MSYTDRYREKSGRRDHIEGGERGEARDAIRRGRRIKRRRLETKRKVERTEGTGGK